MQLLLRTALAGVFHEQLLSKSQFWSAEQTLKQLQRDECWGAYNGRECAQG
jgi:hypothetical protein